MVGHRGQASENVAYVSIWLDTVAPTAFDDRVNDCTALASIGVTEEQPIFLAQRSGPDRILNQVVVDLDFGLFEIELQAAPLCERVAKGFAHGAARQEATAQVPPLQDPVDPSANGLAPT